MTVNCLGGFSSLRNVHNLMQSRASNNGLPLGILGFAWLVAFAMMAPIYCVPPMEHILREQLQLSHTYTILLYAAPLIMVAATAIPGGLIADRIGIKKAGGISIIIITIGTILRGTAIDSSSLLAFTFLYGLFY